VEGCYRRWACQHHYNQVLAGGRGKGVIESTGAKGVMMVYGVWCMVYGVWCMVCGVWCMVCGVWCMVYGVW